MHVQCTVSVSYEVAAIFITLSRLGDTWDGSSVNCQLILKQIKYLFFHEYLSRSLFNSILVDCLIVIF
ncbi:hypothetical protein FKM82_004157 [Ascaphus truei]